MNDSELLHRFIHQRDQAAFAELVQRHVDFVYAAALRHLGGDTHRAQDVSQEVFVDLARKAASLENHPCLSGWLYASTRFTAINTIRREQRRTHRENGADLMPTTSNDPEPTWEHIRPLIDDAMQELDEDDRQPVLLRFFRQQSFGAIGEQLGLSENAAQKRVSRALDQLNTALARRGITSTSAALAIALSQPSVAAPLALAKTVTTAAIASVVGVSVATTGTVTFMSTAKVLVGLGAAAALGVAGGHWRASNIAQRQAIQRDAEFSAKLSALETRVQTESKRADAAEADTAKLLAAIEQARVTRAAAQVVQAPAPAPFASSVTNPIPDDASYVILPGDTAARIAQMRGVTLQQLQALNPDTNWARLKVGQQIRVQ